MKRLLFDGAKSANLDSLPAEAWTIISGRTPGSDDVVEVVRTVPILQRAVMLVSDAVGSMPFAIMRGSTEIDISAEYKNALGILPNLPSMLSLIETSILMWGAGYWFIGRNRGRRAKEIRYLAPTTIRPIIEPGEGLKGFTRIIGSTQIELATDEVVYFWLPDPSIEVGPPSWSPVKAALRAAGVLGSMDKFTTNFFDRGAIKATLLTVPATTRKADRETLRSWWRTVFGGVKNAFATEVINADDVKPVVIGEGIESLSNAELTREKREDIAVALGIPYSLLFPDAANFATAQQDDRHFYQKTIIPACTTIANVINQQLLESFGCVLEFRPEGLDAMQEDEGNRASAFAAYVGAGLKPSLVAQLLGLELPKGVEYEDLDPEEPEQPEPAQPGQPPLPEQAQEAPEPEEKPTPTKGVDTWAGNAQRESEAASVDLRRWRDKALNALKRGESPAVGFVSTTIPADRWSQVKAALESATTADDVRLAFAPQGPQEGADTDAIKALLELDATAYLTQRGIDLPEGTAVEIKRWQIERAGFEGIKTIAYYDRSLSRAVRDFYGGEIDAGEFIDEMIRLVEGQLTRAWNEGMRGNGLDPRKDMTDAWRGILQGEINSEMDHILDYAGQIEQAAANQAPIAPLMGRVALWVNRYQDVLNLALITTAKQEDRFKWIYGDTQHCETCASLNGIVATKAQWDASGFRPQNPPNQMLDCGGWRCQCRLEKTDSPSFGHIPGLSVKYDPDQPRDELGRWTDGGGGVDRAGYQIPGSMGANVFSEKEARFVWNMTRDETREYIKARGADEIAKDTDLTSWEASRYQEAWAGASNNGGGPQDALQILASEMSGDHAPLEPEQLEVQNDEDTMGKASEVFDSVYLRTQAYFESQGLGPNDTIVVYRGMTLDQDIDNAEDVRWRPLSSWSLDQSTAESFAVADLMMPGFGGSWGHVFAMRVKVSDIFSHWSTGFGCANEQEVVLFGKHNPTVKVIKSMYYNDDNWREKT